MSQVRVNESSLTNIADAIRDKNHEVTKYKPSEMPAAISRIKTTEPVFDKLTVTENGKYTPPAEIDGYNEVDVNVQPNLTSINITANGTYTPTDTDGFNEVNVAVEGIPTDADLTITGNCQYKFSNDAWNWFIEKYGNRITTQNISNIAHMFENSKNLERIPFSLNCGNFGTDFDNRNVFHACQALKEIPSIFNLKTKVVARMFYDCHNIRSIPDDYFDTWDFSSVDSYSEWVSIFSYCWSLRSIPVKLLEHASLTQTGYYYSAYNSLAENCYSLDGITNLPVVSRNATLTNNIFVRTVDSAGRLKDLTFKLDPETNAPFVVSWKSQVIDLRIYVGFCTSPNTQFITDYNSGITKDKEVKDDATYAALKNDPDWFTSNINYSRYNHDSAVATINSLPDTSAYLATAGGTNTIKFKGASGSSTDGGAINTLTEAEIAVATAKGWTVDIS